MANASGAITNLMTSTSLENYIERLENLGILVPIEQSNHLADYHKTHKSSQQQNNEK